MIDNAISDGDFPPNLMPIGPFIFSNSISLKPASINLEHLFSCVFLLPRAPI